MASSEASVHMDDIDTFNLTIHVRGLKQFRIRMMIIGWLIWLISKVAPKKVYVGLCDECSEET